MVVCGRCGDNVADTIQCTACKNHYDFPCAGITEKGYRKLGDRQATWRCASCKSLGNPSSQTEALTAPPTSPMVSVEALMREITSIQEKLSPLSHLVSEVQSIRKELADLKASSIEIPAKIQSLEQKMAKVEINQDDITSSKLAIAKLDNELHDTDQWLRSNNIEIKGIPVKDRENLFDVVAKIGDRISYPIVKTHINFVHRVPSNTAEFKNIIVSFTSRYLKEDFIAAARLLKTPLYTKDIGISSGGRIFINDHLTRKNKLLLSQAKSLAKAHHFQFVWVRHMKIFARRDSTSKTIMIKSDQDLQKLH